jgi:glycosyltransferase involved in cell wall biosynthesis
MAKNSGRKRVGLVFSYNEGWIAGSYYILNLIQALNTLEDSIKPVLHIFVNEENDSEIIKNINYPYINYTNIFHCYNPSNYTRFEQIVNRIALKLIKQPMYDKRPKSEDLDVCFPYIGGFSFENLAYIFAKMKYQQRLYWIPDFQDKYLPNFFTADDLVFREKHNSFIAYNNQNNIVFSSLDAKNDFDRFFPNHQAKTEVLHFAVTHPSYEDLSFTNIVNKYKIPENYFFSPNQFWAHKNHIIILKAIKTLKEQGISYTVVFSGKMHDHRNLEYSNELLNFVKDNELEDNIYFLGFIDRAEQLKLMKEAIAIIQPSFFEGWSTVVEDTKAMNQYIILSDLAVHREQMHENVLFFNPNDAIDLANKLQNFNKNYTKFTKINTNYSQNIKKFGEKFIDIINKM